MSTVQDVDTFVSFLEEVFVEGRAHRHHEDLEHDHYNEVHHQSYLVDQPSTSTSSPVAVAEPQRAAVAVSA